MFKILSKKYFILIFIVTSIGMIFALSIAFFLKYMLDIIPSPEANLTIAVLFGALILFGYSISQIIFKYLINKSKKDIGIRIKSQLIDYYSKVYDKEERDESLLLTNYNTLVESHDQFYEAIQKMLYFVFGSISMAIISIPFAILVVVISYLSFFISRFFQNKLTKNVNMFVDENKKYVNTVNEFSAITKIGILNDKHNNIATYYKYENDHLENIRYKQEWFKDKFYVFFEAFSLSSYILIILLGTVFIRNDLLTVGGLIATVQLMNHVVTPSQIIIRNIGLLKSRKLIYDKYTNLVKKFVEQRLDISNNDSIKITGNLTYEDKSIIKDIDLEIMLNGSSYAILGDSGCGKSSIIKALLKTYNFNGLHVEIGKFNYNDLSHLQVLNNFNVVTNSETLVTASLKDNLTLFNNNIDNDEIDLVIEQVGLKEFYNQNEDKILNKDLTLSEGQHQRLNIARSLLYKKKVLIYDEATSSLDLSSSLAITKMLINLDITTIFISHHFTDEINALIDEVYVIENEYLKRAN